MTCVLSSAPAVRVGHYLAVLGDEFQRRHQSDLDRMVQMVLPEILQSSGAGAIAQAYEAFRSVAHRLAVYHTGVPYNKPPIPEHLKKASHGVVS